MFSKHGPFLHEIQTLRRFDHVKNPYIIKLLASFEQPDQEDHINYHLIFPWAWGNLSNFWTNHHEFTKVPGFTTWMARQCTGLASGLALIHNYDEDNDNQTYDLLALTEDGERIPEYGRHGDLKPENILWFPKGTESNGASGTLVLSEFGLTTYHGKRSRSNSPAGTMVVGLTYRPPESDGRGSVSRAFDIWSLGCTFLDFVTWYLRG